jgi:hypothetical protein
MHLVINHVLQSLVECRSKENHYFHLLPCETIVHYFIASQLVAQRMELVGNGLDRVLLLGVLEWCGVSFTAIQCRNLR